MKKFIVIELQDPDFPVIATNNEGQPLIFDSFPDAMEEAVDCQEGQVIELY